MGREKTSTQFSSVGWSMTHVDITMSVLDANVQSTHIPWLNVQLGQYKVYFNRSQINSTAAMQFTDRSLASEAFTASGLNRRDTGITIMNDEEVYPVNYYFGVFNGSGPLVNRFAQFTSEEPTLGCPGGQTGGNPFPSPTIRITSRAGSIR